jgi:nicotinate-nucleotide adenylyltransferase
VNNNKTTYTIETVKYIKNKFNPTYIYLIIGADSLQSLTKWYEYDKLKELVEFVIAKRDNIEITNYKTIDINQNISSTQLRNGKNLEFIPLQIKQDFIKILNS